MALALEKQNLRNKEGLLGSRRRPENGDWPLASSEVERLPDSTALAHVKGMCLEIRGQRFEKSFVKSRICVCLYLIHFHTVQMWLQQLKTFTEQEKKSWWKDCYWNGSLRNENSVIVHSLQTCETFFCGTLQKISEVREVQCWTKTVIEISFCIPLHEWSAVSPLVLRHLHWNDCFRTHAVLNTRCVSGGVRQIFLLHSIQRVNSIKLNSKSRNTNSKCV